MKRGSQESTAITTSKKKVCSKTSKSQTHGSVAAAGGTGAALLVQVEAQLLELVVVLDELLLAAVQVAQLVLVGGHLEDGGNQKPKIEKK